MPEKEKEILTEADFKDDEEGYYEYDEEYFKEDLDEEDLEELEEAEEIEEEVEEEEQEEEKPSKDEAKTETPKRELPPEINEILKRIPEDAEVKSKGMSFPAKELTQEEVLALLNKGFRFYQAMEELAKKEKELRAKEEELSRAFQQIMEYQAKFSQVQQSQVSPQRQTSKTLPPELEPSEDDTPEIAAIKKAAAIALEKASKVEESFQSILNEKKMAETQASLMKEIESAVSDFPLASPEEVLLVYLASGGKASIKELAALSHKHRANMDYVKKLITHVPEVKKALEDEIIKEYLAKKTEKNVPVKSGTTKKVVSMKKKPEAITFDNVSQIIRQALKEAKPEEED